MKVLGALVNSKGITNRVVNLIEKQFSIHLLVSSLFGGPTMQVNFRKKIIEPLNSSIMPSNLELG
jgi:hypothetical protein